MLYWGDYLAIAIVLSVGSFCIGVVYGSKRED
jgi:hypothetical protein